MLFKQDILRKIAAGEVTVAFRRWTKPTVRSGGSLRIAVGVLAIDSVDIVDPKSISDQDAARAGFSSRDELFPDPERRAGGSFYRIAFHLAGADPRVNLREQDSISADDLAGLQHRFASLDERSDGKPWAMRTLRLIQTREGAPAADIAAAVGMEKLALKARIRTLKELGLTESLKIGYRLSPRGRAFLRLSTHATSGSRSE